MTETPETQAVQPLTVPHNQDDDPSMYKDDFDYSQHVPIEVPVGPWDCLDRACEQTAC
ncbi:hypothetical protein [Streptomyces sp. CoH27]|uniref:hypothetical protein n=1 Tax=Streptomyces sp. CoH27 TaxID=2875763 RepID=UPI001CD6FF23|nr:hypothetical protein [Streptomyces sp. CoH27]